MATRADERGWGPGWPNCQADRFVKVVLSNGVRVIARREIAELAKLLFEEGIRRGYDPLDGQTWGASCRPIKGTKTPSNHSWALAFDINSLANPQRRPLTTDMPRWFIELWKAYGFRWGGDYTSATPDSMHFEYMGTPQSAVIDTARARAALAESGHEPVPVPPPVHVPSEEDDMAKAFTYDADLDVLAVESNGELVQRYYQPGKGWGRSVLHTDARVGAEPSLVKDWGGTQGRLDVFVEHRDAGTIHCWWVRGQAGGWGREVLAS